MVVETKRLRTECDNPTGGNSQAKKIEPRPCRVIHKFDLNRLQTKGNRSLLAAPPTEMTTHSLTMTGMVM